MFNLKSNSAKSILLVILGLIVLYIYLGDGGRKERTLKSELVSIDTAKVNEIIITPKSSSETVKLLKKNKDWRVELSGEKSARVPKEKIENLLSTLVKIKPKRLVSRKKEKWEEYQVGEKGTKVKVFEDGDESLNIIIGKFSFQQPRQMNSYVRLADENDVYEVEGFLEMIFNKKKEQFRDNNILKENEREWKSLTFKYKDNSFSIMKDNGVWKIDGVKTDSAKTVQYLRSIAHLTSTDYVDSFKDGTIVKSIVIERNDSTTVTINELFADSVSAINSSVNSESYFNATTNGLSNKIFVDKTKFLK